MKTEYVIYDIVDKKLFGYSQIDQWVPFSPGSLYQVYLYEEHHQKPMMREGYCWLRHDEVKFTFHIQILVLI